MSKPPLKDKLSIFERMQSVKSTEDLLTDSCAWSTTWYRGYTASYKTLHKYDYSLLFCLACTQNENSQAWSEGRGSVQGVGCWALAHECYDLFCRVPDLSRGCKVVWWLLAFVTFSIIEHCEISALASHEKELYMSKARDSNSHLGRISEILKGRTKLFGEKKNLESLQRKKREKIKYERWECVFI